MIERNPKILKIKTKRGPHKLIPISAPAYIHEYMTLYCLAKGITKSKIIKDFVADWVTKHRETDPDDALIEEIANDMSGKYIVELKHKQSPDEFKVALGLELGRNGVKASYAQTIISKLRI